MKILSEPILSINSLACQAVLIMCVSYLLTGSIPKTKTYCVHHKGPYRHIGNAWNALYSRLRAKKFKPNKSLDPMEFYLNSPMDTVENDLETEIHFAVK